MDDQNNEPILWQLQVRLLPEKWDHNHHWDQARQNHVNLIHEAFVRSMVDLGLVQGIFQMGGEGDRELWLIWAPGPNEAIELTLRTPLGDAGLICQWSHVASVRPKYLTRPLVKALRTPGYSRIFHWLTRGMSIEEMRSALEERYLTQAEKIILNYRLWFWLKKGIAFIPGRDSQESARSLHHLLLQYIDSCQKVDEAQAAYEDGVRAARHSRAWLSEHGIDIDQLAQGGSEEYLSARGVFGENTQDYLEGTSDSDFLDEDNSKD